MFLVRAVMLLLLAGGIADWAGAARAEVVIHEIHYHPASHDPADEFIELWNGGAHAVDLSGWRMDAGVRLEIPQGLVVAPGEFVLLVADPLRWANLGGLRAVVIGPWAGRLSNAGEEVVLTDASGRVQDRVRYAQDGDFALRVRAPLDHGHRGWAWEAPHDGEGASLELIQSRLPNEVGQNWAPSLVPGGTPGRANSAAADNVAPLVTGVSQDPALPLPEDGVVVRARLWDESGPEGLRAQLRFRAQWGTNVVESAREMTDDGRWPDRSRWDGECTARIPPQPAGAVVEFWIHAQDAAGRARVWPPAVRGDDGEESGPGALYAVESAPPNRTRPEVRLVLRLADADELRQINGRRPVSPIPDQDETRSHAEFDGTWVAMVDGVAEVRYRVGIRNRGNGSRVAFPQSFRVNFPGDRTWEGRRAVNLASQAPDVQVLGSRLARLAGLPAATSRPILLRLNGVPLNSEAPIATNSATGTFYALNEVIDADYLERQFPLESGGAAYRAQRRDFPLLHAGLDDLGDSADAYRPIYFKRTDAALDDWSDLLGLIRVLRDARETHFLADVSGAVAVDEWVRYFALNVLLDNRETSPANGHGDDYSLARGEQDRRFQLVPYDFDSILGVGGFGGPAAVGLFPMLNGRVPVFARFLTNAAVRPRYLAEIVRQGRALGELGRGGAEVDSALRDWVPVSRREALTAYLIERARHLRSLVSQELGMTDEPPSESVEQPRVLISEWRAASRQPGVPDFVEVFNPGPLPLDLSGHFLTDQPLGWPRRTQIPAGTVLAPGATRIWWSSTDVAERALGFRLRAADGELALVSPDGVVLDHVIHAWQPADVSLGRRGGAHAEVRLLGEPSPGVPSSDQGIILNEVMVAPMLDAEPWIEVINVGTHPVSMRGVQVAAVAGEAGTSLSVGEEFVAPGERRVVPLPEFVLRVAPEAWEEVPAWPPEGGSLFLLDREGAVLDSIRWGPQVAGHSMARRETGTEWGLGGAAWTLAHPTPGSTNLAATISNSATGVRINEWMAAPRAGRDWVELMNLGSVPVDLGDVSVSDDPLEPARFRFPRGSYLGAGANGYLYLSAAPAAVRSPALGFALSRAGEQLVVWDGERTVDRTAWSQSLEGVSAGRFPDGTAPEGNSLRRATPGRPNAWTEGPDLNGNGLPDLWEISRGLELGEDLDTDPDHDGHTTRTEWQVGSDPRDGASAFRMRVRSVAAGGVLTVRRFQFEAWVPTGRRVRVEVAEGADGIWVPVGILEPATFDGWRRLRVDPDASGTRLVRLHLEP